MRHHGPIRAITLDLDDTLWPFAPVAQRIQAALEGSSRSTSTAR